MQRVVMGPVKSAGWVFARALSAPGAYQIFQVEHLKFGIVWNKDECSLEYKTS